MAGSDPRDHPGTGGVPADLQFGAPRVDAQAAGLGRPGPCLRRRRARRHAGRRADLFPCRSRAAGRRFLPLHRWRPQRRRGAHGFQPRDRHDPGGPRGPDLLGFHRGTAAQPVRGRVPARGIRRRAVPRRPPWQAQPARDRSVARRGRADRLRPGAGARAGHVALGHHDDRRAGAGPDARGRGTLCLPAVGAGHRAGGWLRRVQADDRRSDGDAAAGVDPDRRGRVGRGRLFLYRVLPEGSGRDGRSAAIASRRRRRSASP